MSQEKNKESFLFGSNIAFIEEVYERYLQDKNSVDASWRELFDELGDSLESIIKNHKGASWAPKKTAIVGYVDPETRAAANKNAKGGPASDVACRDSINALMLIRAYKVRGHLFAELDPLGLEGNKEHPDLNPATYGFSDDDFDREIYLGGALGLERATLRQVLDVLRRTYSSRIGVEFMHIPSLAQREWIANRIEQVQGRPQISHDAKRTILEDMVKVEVFEQFLHTKYPGAKRFSAEGGEAVFAAMEKIIERAAGLGMKEVVIGMPHRGRLNVLTKVMGRRYAAMLSEFQGNLATIPEDIDASGDVKYHQGASSDRDFDGQKIHLSLAANPSHLEAVNPVVVGRVRAKQDQRKDGARDSSMGLLLHGDAAFCGQGIVPETMALSDLEGYMTGGTVHIIVNNQIGFTTSPKYGRTSPYPSDIAKGCHAPIFHVNGDDPEAVVFAATLATEFRQEFKNDVVVDVFCYRRYGHNEGDEPFFTQPLMYKAIANHPTPMNVYAKALISEGAITEDDFEQMKKKFRDFLDSELEASQTYKPTEADWLGGSWKGLDAGRDAMFKKIKTGVEEKTLKEIGKVLTTAPAEHKIHSKIERLLKNKQKMFETGKGFDWATGEALAFGSLLKEGFPIRMSGQDSIRGTFSQRHSAFIDQENESRYFPLKNLGEGQANLEIIDSNLSEFAVLGFEYGYTLAEPNALVLWEAQFGDFSNGAQVIMDQFISAGERKWLRLSGLVMLLPHGYEGQGPEHSSARPERFLQMCAEDNMQVANCTTPASYYHILRRQLHRSFRKPLIIMTPKSLLRHPLCVSELKDFAKGTHFQEVIPETEKLAADDKIKRVVICSGKVYYDLLKTRTERNIKDVAIVRLEQYYPFPAEALKTELKRYKNAEVVWCQEEPENMGAWHFVDRRIERVLSEVKGKSERPRYVGRPASAAPAAGYMKIFQQKQAALVDEALK